MAEEKFCIPDKKTCSGMKYASYDNLDTNGIVKIGSKVGPNDVLIGKISPIVSNNGLNKSNIKFKDNSTCMRHNESGIVDKIVITKNQDGYKFCKVKIRSTRVPEIGDKLASRSGQKGTIGMVYKHEDMPFTKDGITPDVIMNPHAIPSRMTVSQIIETIMGKIGSLKGKRFDATPFNNKFNVKNLVQELHELGFHKSGKEILYNGQTGEQMETMIFIGPVYYQRLKHMVQDKIHSRAKGPVQNLTRQPAEGRSRDGGLRLGEMEVDCLYAHGTSAFLKERTYDCSDPYEVFICNSCGLFSSVNENTKKYECKSCNNYSDFSKVKLPYASKLFFQHLQAQSIAPRMYCE